MNIQSRSILWRTFVGAGSVLILSAPAAKAQFFDFSFGSGLRPGQVERMLEARGLWLVGPVSRNGSVYIADVEGPNGEPRRFIIDAYDGRVLERFRPATPPRAYGEATQRYDDVTSPRPPADIGIVSVQPHRPVPNTTGAPATVITFGDTLARTEDSQSPNVILAPRAAGESSDAASKSKIRAQVKHKKIDLTPVAQPAPSPAPAKPAAAVASKEAGRPADVKVETPVVPAATPAPAPVHTTPVAAAAPPVAPPAPAAPKAPAAKPTVNDVPVDPLE